MGKAKKFRGKTVKVKYPKEGVWQTPDERGYLLTCCDCGLVHRFDFRVKDGRAQMRGYRDDARTEFFRKMEKIKMLSHAE